MDAHPEISRVAAQVRSALASQGLSLGSVARDLGLPASTLSRALNGNAALRFDHVFSLLRRLELDPELFFEELFPVAGERPPELRPAYGLRFFRRPGEAQSGLESERMPSRALGWDGDEAVDEASLWLAELVRHAGRTPLEVSRAAGLPGSAIRAVLRGEAVLTFQALFAILAALGRRPAFFFFALVTSKPKALAEDLSYLRMLEVFEQALVQSLDGLEQQKKEGTYRPPRRLQKKLGPKPSR